MRPQWREVGFVKCSGAAVVARSRCYKMFGFVMASCRKVFGCGRSGEKSVLLVFVSIVASCRFYTVRVRSGERSVL